MVRFLKIVGVLLILGGVVFLIRFGLGGNEDTWICQNGQWVKHGNPKEAAPLVPCTKDGQTAEDVTPGSVSPVSLEESREIALTFAKNSSTFKFDGMELKGGTSETLNCPYCFEFAFTYQSRQAGYGDRKGQLLAQVITPHTIKVTVKEGVVAAAVVDGIFDELNLKFLK